MNVREAPSVPSTVFSHVGTPMQSKSRSINRVYATRFRKSQCMPSATAAPQNIGMQ